MCVESPPGSKFKGKTSAFTLVEVVCSLAIIAIVFSGIIVSYTQAARRVEWSGRSLAAQALAIQVIEQARSGVWDEALRAMDSNQGDDLMKLNVLDRSTNLVAGTLTGYTAQVLDLPSSGTNQIWATNYVSIRTLFVGGTTNPTTAKVRMIRVDTAWPFTWMGVTRYYSNTLTTYVAPDNRDPRTLYGSY